MPQGVHLSRMTPVSFLERSAAAFPARVAVVDGDRRVTWAELRERVRRLAVALQESGLEKGDRVAFLAPNTCELLEAHYGVPAAGGVLVAINTRLTSNEIAYILDHSAARVLVVDRSLAHLVDGASVERVLVCGQGGDYEDFLSSARDGEPEDRLVSEDDTISINYTSGTTGRPKGVMYTYRGAYLNALAELVHARLDSRSVYLWTLPMFHCNGWCFTWAVTAVGATHVCLPKVDPPLVWKLLADEGVTHMNGAPTVLVMLASDAAAHRDQPPVRPDRDVRADHDLRMEPRLGRARRRGARPPEGAAGTAHGDRRSGARGRQRAERRSGGRRDDGRSRHARKQCDEGLLRRRGRDCRSVSRRLVPLRRPRRDASRRLRRAPRPREGHHHLGRREHLDDRGRARARSPSRRARGRRGRDPRREMGRESEGVRDAQAWSHDHHGRVDRLLARDAGGLQG